MPVYTYKCRKCGRTYDDIESMANPPQTTCTLRITEPSSVEGHLECGGEVYRVISGAAVQYKGGGWTGAGRDRQR